MKHRGKIVKKNKYDFRSIIVITIVSVFFIKYVLISLYDNTRLGWYGKPTFAIISSKKYKGARRHGPGKFYYSFRIDGKTYLGSVEKKPGILIGDTISIFYLESDPSVNCSYDYVKGIFFQRLVD